VTQLSGLFAAVNTKIS